MQSFLSILYLKKKKITDSNKKIDDNRYSKKKVGKIGHTLKHGNEAHSLTIEAMVVKKTRSKGKPRTRYIS